MFERKSMEQLVEKAVGWIRGTTTKLTDFRVGSKTRTLLEAVAVIVEELYDKVYRAIKKLIEENIYSVIGFDKIPATYASGNVVFSRATPAEADIIIPAGTLLLSKATSVKAPTRYRTTKEVKIQIGQTSSSEVEVVSIEPGTVGNTGANTITEFLSKPTGVDSATNPTALINGKEAESKEAQKTRFQEFVDANARGIIQAVEYGAKLAKIESSDGVVQERVQQAKAVEILPDRKGEVDIYLWNGIGNASQALKDEARKILFGYYDENNNVVYGYKPAGIIPNIYTAPIKYVTIKLEITSEEWITDTTDLQKEVEQEIDTHFGNFKMGNTVLQTELEAKIKYIEGVYDVKLYFSLDSGTTYDTNNIPTAFNEIAVASKPINYVWG